MIDTHRHRAEIESYVKHYRLGQPLLSLEVEACSLILYRQHDTGTVWCIEIDEHGASGSGGGEFGWTLRGPQRIMYGLLPDAATQVEATLRDTSQVSIHLANRVFLAIAQSTEAISLTFKDNHGTIVDQRFVPAWYPRDVTIFTRFRRRWQWWCAGYHAARSSVRYGAYEKQQSSWKKRSR